MKEPSWLILLFFASIYCQACRPINEKDCGACPNTYLFDGNCLPCDQAKDEFSCQICKGFYFRQGQCLSCSSLTNPGLCQECRGYFFSDGKCQPCELSTPYLCTLQCPDYFLKRGICTHCSMATDELTCKFCRSPFEFKGGKCQQCAKHYETSLFEYECMSCAGANNVLLCSKCDEFYFANNTCSSCRTAKTSKECSLCPGFYFQEGICKHCSEAGKANCGLCKGFTLEGEFCVPCQLISNSTTCQSCQLYRYSTDRDMCVPCTQKGYFLNGERGYCQHCLTAITQEACSSCPGYTFDKWNRTCLKCSEIISSSVCNSCLNYFFDRSSQTCMECANASVLTCLLYCPLFFYGKGSCTRCVEAKSAIECKTCASYYWSGSGKCQYCYLSDFFIRNSIRDSQCVACANATANECRSCPLYTFSNGKCQLCKYATTRQACDSCRLKGFYFSQNGTCSHCHFVSEFNCNSINCPGYGYFNGSCIPAVKISTEAGCMSFNFFSWTKDGGCDYCKQNDEYYNFNTGSCTKCSNFQNIANCSYCPSFYFNEEKKTCQSCATIYTQQLCSKCLSYVFISRKCVPCENITKKSDCDKCPNYIYRKGQCLKCSEAISFEQCKTCQNHVFEDLTCKRCQQVTNMMKCEKDCVSLGYFPSRNQRICMPCFSARNQLSCLLCLNHVWDNETKICSNCSQSEKTCQQCLGMYWNQNSCKLCPANCNRCTDGKLCLECKVSFVLAEDKSACRKVCNAQYCHKCSYNSSQFCEECKFDYNTIQTKGICTINCMVERCQTCKSNSICKTCENGYTLQLDGLCKCSIEFCDSCQGINKTNSSQGSAKCNRCVLGYKYNNESNSCTKIDCRMENCEVCKNETTCDTCKFGWSRSYGRCLPICDIVGCKECSSQATCQTCQSNFKIFKDQTCEPLCNIENCLRCNSFTTCSTCKPDFVLAKNSTVCNQTCVPGFYQSGEVCQACEKAVQNCQTCQQTAKTSVECIKCQPSYYLLQDQCVSCRVQIPHCINCLSFAEKTYCRNCAFGFSLIGKRCRKCAENCLACEARGEDDCDVCIKGYVYDTQTSNKVKCIPCLNNCMECYQFNVSQCASCFPGHYLNKSKCLKCPLNCKVCSDEKVCKNCNDGYLLGSQGCLMKKTPFCKTEVVASNGLNTMCLLCVDGYYHIGNACVSIACTSPGSNCTVCPPKQYLSQGVCLPCPSLNKCQSCDAKSPLKCDTCMKNYYLQRNKQCYPCMKGCETCTSKYNCTSAEPGYYLMESVSIPFKCPSMCAACENSYICSACTRGYQLYRRKCISQQALRMNITVVPVPSSWARLSNASKLDSLIRSWSFYHSELMKLIGYEGFEDSVFVDAVSVGSITFSLIIDKQPTQSIAALIDEVQASIKQGSKTLSVLKYDKLQKPRAIQNKIVQTYRENQPKFFIATIILSSVFVCILVIIGVKRYLKKQVTNTAQAKQEKQEKQEVPTYNHLAGRRDQGSDSSSDKDTKGEKKNEEPTQILEVVSNIE